MNRALNARPFLVQLPIPVDGEVESIVTTPPPGAKVVAPSDVAGAVGLVRSVMWTSQVPTRFESSEARAVIGVRAAAPMPRAPALAPINSCRRFSLSLDMIHPPPNALLHPWRGAERRLTYSGQGLSWK